jgi:hypothetical protein
MTTTVLPIPEQPAPFIRFESWDANRARWGLAYNTDNRRIKEANVAAMGRDMATGAWNEQTVEPIKFTGTPEAPGELIDGQNRLHAIIAADARIGLWVAYNIPKRAQEVMDSGAKRTMADTLRLRHVPYPTTVAAALRFLVRLKHNELDGRRMAASKAELLALFDDVGDDLLECAPLGEAFSRGGGFGSGGMATALVYLFMQADPDQAPKFFELAISGEGLYAGNAIYSLRRRLAETRKPPMDTRAALTIKAFNFWRSGQYVERLGWARGGTHPEPFPEVWPADAIG